MTMFFTNRDNLTSFFAICIYFTFLLIALNGASTMMLNRSGKSRYHCLFPDLKRKEFNFLSLNMILMWVFVDVFHLCQTKKILFHF